MLREKTNILCDVQTFCTCSFIFIIYDSGVFSFCLVSKAEESITEIEETMSQNQLGSTDCF
jgi:hypothetical protein